jgi:TolA-binding protein
MKKLLALTIMMASCFLANSALAAPSTSTTSNTPATSSKPKAAKSKYNTWMKIGYSAYNKKDYNTALINFKRALKLRPNDVYAKRAIQNTEKRLAGK